MRKVFFQLVLPLVGIAGILGFITLTNPIQHEQASWQIPYGQHYACGGITVYLAPAAESPSACSSGTAPGMTSYRSTIDIWAQGSNMSNYTVHYNWLSFWCQQKGTPCTGSGHETGIQTMPASSAIVSLSSIPMSAQGQFAGKACGFYQNDFGFYVTDNQGNKVCNAALDLNNLQNANNNASTCDTGTSCVAAPTPIPVHHTATPIKTVQPTATPTQQPIPTATPTGQPTATPTQIPIPTATSTNTGNCSGTTQVGVNGSNNNNNCNQNTNNNSNAQSQTQTQNNNQTVNISLQGPAPTQTQIVLAAATIPQLPNTGAGSDVLFGLLALVPIGWKIRKLV